MVLEDRDTLDGLPGKLVARFSAFEAFPLTDLYAAPASRLRHANEPDEFEEATSAQGGDRIAALEAQLATVLELLKTTGGTLPQTPAPAAPAAPPTPLSGDVPVPVDTTPPAPPSLADAPVAPDALAPSGSENAATGEATVVTEPPAAEAPAKSGWPGF